MHLQNLVNFTQGTAFMFLLISSFYFLKMRADRLRSILGLVLLYGLFLNIVDFAFFEPRSPNTDKFVSILCITAVPACAFILYELMLPRSVTWKVILIHESPCVFLVILYTITFSDLVYSISLIFVALYTIIFATVLFFSIPKYYKKLKEEYSFTENLEIKWLWGILLLFIVFFIIWIHTSFIDNKVAQIVYYIGTSVIWTSVGYFISRHQQALKVTKESQSQCCDNDSVVPKLFAIELETEQCAPLTDSVQQYHFAEQLKYLFENKKIYLNPKLTLADVASEIGTNRTYLSDYLNRVLETNFFDYVNEFRLGYAGELLMNDFSLTLEHVAEQAGFNSLSTFRRSFTKRYSCTPHNYRKNIKIQV